MHNLILTSNPEKTKFHARCSCGHDLGKFNDRQTARNAGTEHAVKILGGAI